ncbi:restriction endonuclease subunit S [Prosthecochloris sp. CIB 2401]|uniref:restriction endonuclease subunit S n=1 Tax=Prosthecochloris sp. CIB 2401 TaxID=1868325 RepID=UPI00080AAD44|nr:restriction endonuclease subunit S [Prosthecochloris sp. CIB 2401]ANT65295.1 EcoKI restriction-modification system protein HsdS [Prosthecochloris sp. CIB 2401]
MSTTAHPEGWVFKPFPKTVSRYQSKGGKLKTSEYEQSGALPVVDQGQSLVIGYCSADSRKFQGPHPIIVFGDHTRNVKLVDFPFAVGADGVVLLGPADREKLDIKFLYYWLKYVPLHNLGYSRHFKLLKEEKISFPNDIDEQRRIVARIEELTRRAEEARKLRQEAVAQIATQFFHIRRKIYQSLLSEFPTKSLRKCGKVIGGGTPSKQRADYWDGDIPWVSAKDMKAFFLTDSGLKITKRGLSESSAKLIPENSVLFVVRGSILYRYVPIAVNSMPCTINQDLKAIIPAKGINAIYLAHMLWAANDILLGMVEEAGNTAGKLPTPSWSELDIPIPDETKQESVVKELTALQEKLLELESLQAETAQELEQFQTALLAKAFRGEL